MNLEAFSFFRDRNLNFYPSICQLVCHASDDPNGSNAKAAERRCLSRLNTHLEWKLISQGQFDHFSALVRAVRAEQKAAVDCGESDNNPRGMQ